MTGPVLRRVTRADGPALVEGHLRSRALHGDWLRPFADLAGFALWHEHGLLGGRISFIAAEPDTGEICGVVSLSEIVLGAFRSAYLGYYGMAGFERRGLMTAAVRAAVRFAFDELELHRVEANIQPGNAASVALVRRLGFRLEGFSPRYLKVGGEWRDHERWALLSDEADTPA